MPHQQILLQVRIVHQLFHRVSCPVQQVIARGFALGIVNALNPVPSDISSNLFAPVGQPN